MVDLRADRSVVFVCGLGTVFRRPRSAIPRVNDVVRLRQRRRLRIIRQRPNRHVAWVCVGAGTNTPAVTIRFCHGCAATKSALGANGKSAVIGYVDRIRGVENMRVNKRRGQQSPSLLRSFVFKQLRPYRRRLLGLAGGFGFLGGILERCAFEPVRQPAALDVTAARRHFSSPPRR